MLDGRPEPTAVAVAALRDCPPPPRCCGSRVGSPPGFSPGQGRLASAGGTDLGTPLSPSLVPWVPGRLARRRPRGRRGSGAAPRERCLESCLIWADGLVSQRELRLNPTCSAVSPTQSPMSLSVFKLTVCVFYVYGCADFLPSYELFRYWDFNVILSNLKAFVWDFGYERYCYWFLCCLSSKDIGH